jgi:hypothetical protein
MCVLRLLVVVGLLSFGASAQRIRPFPPAAERPQTNDVVLDVHLSVRTLQPGGSLLANVQMRNVSSDEIRMVAGASDVLDFDMDLTTLDGELVSHVGPRDFRTGEITLLPGMDWMDVLDVGSSFDLQPGHYALRVRREVTGGEARSVPVVFSVVEGARPDARSAAVSDPQRAAADAVTAGIMENAPIAVSGPTETLSIPQRGSSTVPLTLTNRSPEPVRYSWFEWIRMEVEHPDGRTTQVFDQKAQRDNDQLVRLGVIAPQASARFDAVLEDRYTFPEAGDYVLRFWFPRSAGPYSLPVTVTAN